MAAIALDIVFQPARFFFIQLETCRLGTEAFVLRFQVAANAIQLFLRGA